MPNTTYKVQNICDEGERPLYTTETDDIYDALDKSWALYKMTERDVEVIDLHPFNEAGDTQLDEPRRIATLRVEFCDE